jgi:hypothetical protein
MRNSKEPSDRKISVLVCTVTTRSGFSRSAMRSRDIECVELILVQKWLVEGMRRTDLRKKASTVLFNFFLRGISVGVSRLSLVFVSDFGRSVRVQKRVLVSARARQQHTS